MTILVTGATGNIGRRVVEGLIGAGQRVRAMSRTPALAKLPAGVEVVHGDFDRPETWPAVLAGVARAYVFPFAYYSPGSGDGFVERAAKAGVRRMVTHSAAAAGFDAADSSSSDASLSALRRHLAVEREAHRGIELLVEASAAEWTHIRPGLLAVGALSWADQIRRGRVVREPYGASGYPLVHEADVAEIAVAALLTDAHVGAAYTLTGPAKVTQAEQVAAIGAAIGVPVRFEELTPEDGRAGWIRDGLPEDMADWLIELQVDAVDGYGALPPTDTYERLTGRKPRSFAQWAKDHAVDFA